MGLIDADVMMKHMENLFCDNCDTPRKRGWCDVCDYKFFMNEMKKEQTVDAVPVIRCKDCVYFWDGVCTAHTDAICTDENEFCSWGEKRENEID